MSPVTIGTYGSGKATLTDFSPYTDSIVQLTNSEYVTVKIRGSSGRWAEATATTNFAPLNTSYGLYVVSYRSTGHGSPFTLLRGRVPGHPVWCFLRRQHGPGGPRLQRPQLHRLIVDGVYQAGVYVIGYGSNAGGPVDQSSNVSISDNQFRNILGYPEYASEAQPLFVGGTVGITIERNLFATTAASVAFTWHTPRRFYGVQRGKLPRLPGPVQRGLRHQVTHPLGRQRHRRRPGCAKWRDRLQPYVQHHGPAIQFGRTAAR